MTEMTSLDPVKLDAAIGKTFSELGVGVTGPLIVLVDRLGLWAALAGAGPTNPVDLADRTGLNERYLSEWLRAIAVAGYLEYGSQERFTRPLYEAGLASAWLPAVDGAVIALRAGGRMLDVGCGRGVASLVVARAYPQAWITGIDTDDASIAYARKCAAEAGFSDRLTFEVADATEPPGGPYDVVMFADSLHDMGDPTAAIAAAGHLLTPRGTLLVVEPLAGDDFEDDFANPYARIGYAISAMACLPSALEQGGPAALGAMAGEVRLREVLAAGGMGQVRRIDADYAHFNILLQVRP